MPINFGVPGRRKRMGRAGQLLSIGLLVSVLGASVWAILNVAAHYNGKGVTPTPVARLTATPTLVYGATPSVSPTPGSKAPPLSRYRPGQQTGQTNPSSAGAGTGLATTSGSALLFGTNLSLYDVNDQFLTSAATRTLLQQMHVHIVRVPMRSTLSDVTMIQVAQMIKSIGAVPLFILRTEDTDPNALADDSKLITNVSKVFGSSTIYFEYGNEEDFLGFTATQYTAAWNKDIPQFKKIAPNAKFIGSANYHYDGVYLQAFLKGAKPSPDMVSWHEYTCALSWTNAVCLSHIDNWTVHIANSRNIMKSTIGANLPIMITEWNYTPDPKASGNGKTADTAFMTTWTMKALQTLAANNIFASMEYACTNSSLNLVSSTGAITTQGTTFQKMYSQMVR
jgi:hypothetical protein